MMLQQGQHMPNAKSSNKVPFNFVFLIDVKYSRELMLNVGTKNIRQSVANAVWPRWTVTKT